MTRWQGSVALVTGASSGIGSAIATRLLSDGVRVVACGRRLAPLQALSAHGEVLPIVCDLRDESQILAMFDEADRVFGGIDVLVNNAGLGFGQPLHTGDTEKWREVLEVNVLALSICTREYLQRFGDRVRGHVIHVSSMSGHRIPPGSGMYGASKFAVRALTEGLRQELRAANSPIRVTALSPGNVQTAFFSNLQDWEPHGYRILDAADIAEMVSWVLSAPDHAEIHDILVRPTAQRL